jgi:glycosyltransferase involved in cell wall biosynthesis
MMTPYTHDPRQVSFCDPLVARCDLYLAITGRFWFNSIESSLFAHWRPKMIHVDLAVDRDDFPIVKDRFNPRGSRRFLYIGHDGWQKNPRYLEELANTMAGSSFSWMGVGKRIEGFKRLGAQDFRTDVARELVASHDFMVTVGEFDANPTTILEAMAWGLIPVCTPTSGYEGYAGIVNIPLNNAREAVRVLGELQNAPSEELMKMQRVNWQALDSHFNWDRFADQVLDAIRSERRPTILHENFGRKLRLCASALTSPHQRTSATLLARKVKRVLR